MGGLWVERLRCLMRGHTWAWHGRDKQYGYICTDCLTFRRRLF